mgnify:CR=1 FL=1
MSKVHKLLRHLLDAIRLHGNLQNGNTGSNEAGHEVDEAFYSRTNKVMKSDTQQIKRQSLGAQAVLARNINLDHAASSSHRCVRPLASRAFRGVPRLSLGTLSCPPGLAHMRADRVQLVGYQTQKTNRYASPEPGSETGASVH